MVLRPDLPEPNDIGGRSSDAVHLQRRWRGGSISTRLKWLWRFFDLLSAAFYRRLVAFGQS
jgi:hypothetical protein